MDLASKLRWLISITIVLIWLADPHDAEACSCGLGEGYPASGDTNVPLDVELAYPSDGGVAPVLRSADGTEVMTEVRSETGLILSATWYLLTPLEELAPETEYDLSGTFRSVRFTTGKQRSVGTPAPSDVQEFFLAHSDNLGLCEASLCTNSDEWRTTVLSYKPSYDAVYYELVITTENETWRRLVTASFFGYLGGFCSSSPYIAPGQTACAELLAVGANGARAATGEIACNTVLSCAISDCDLEQLQMCHQADFVPGPIEFPKVGDHESGCGVSGDSRGGAAVLLLLVMLGIRRKT